jgi:DNA-binding CsgD family transcriptional regulator/tetratricopeptide (TPR) repeat protein
VKRLREAWDDALAGAPGLVLIRGEAGIGKSRLVDELIGYVRESDGSVLIGSCSPFLDGVAPYAPIRDALEPMVADESVLTDRSREALQRTLFPDSLSVPPGQPGSVGPDLGQGQAFTAIRHAVLEAALRRPIMLVIEDIHWADVSTVQLLSTMERGLRHSISEHRLLVLLTCRSALDGRDEQIGPFLHEFRRSPLTDVLELGPLDAAASAELLTVLTGGAATADRLTVLIPRADGNPFLLEELAATGSDVIPDSAREMLELRLRRLPSAAADAVRAASVLGSQIDPDELAALVDIDDLRTAIEQAVSAEVLVAVGERYVFRHALLQELLLSQLFASDRRRLHACAAAWLEANGSDRIDGARIAYHYIQAGDAAAALTWSVRAAVEAEQLGAIPEALGHYERALDSLDRAGRVPEGLPDRAELTYLAGTLAASLGLHARGAELLGRAAELFAVSGERHQQAKALTQRGYALCHVDLTAALACSDQALALLNDCASTEENAILLGQTGAALLYALRPDDAMPRLARAARMAEDVGSELATAYVDIGYGIALQSSPEGLARLRAALEVLRRLRDARFLLCAWSLQLVLNFHGELEGVVQVGLDALDTVSDWGGSEHWWAVTVRELLASSAYELGDWDLAATHANLAIELAKGGNDVSPAAAIAVHLGRGELADARALLEFARGRMQLGFLRHLAQEAELATLEGRYDDALDVFRTGMRLVTGTEAEPRCGYLLLVGARAAADQAALAPPRRAEQRRQLADLETELRHLAQRAATCPCGPAPLPLFDTNEAVRAQWSAELARLNGIDDLPGWLAVADRWRGLRRPYSEAYCLMRAAAAGIAQRQPAAETRAALLPALTIAERLRAKPLMEQGRALADASHVTFPAPRRSADQPAASASADRYGLTAREREVLTLLAEGLTNAQLASRLYISTHTANVHVSRILMKLGVPNRTQAASLAWSQGLVAVADAAE